MFGGYANRIARIDLTTGEVAYEEIDKEIARTYIGGRGMGVKFVKPPKKLKETILTMVKRVAVLEPEHSKTK